jgi:MoaA/NifB/PqqE/SkfB family radical SAM enzyme
MDFPEIVSFTVTNTCNLRCRMCGQWSAEGYIKNNAIDRRSHMSIQDWKRLVDEAANYKIRFILIRGGEPFLLPGIMELIDHIKSKGIFLSIDTNGTVIDRYAADLVRFEGMHITFSVDGPEQIHDTVRGVAGSFKKTKENIALFNDLEKAKAKKISKSICFTISPYSYKGLGAMPDVARDLGISLMSIVPYFYVPADIGTLYEKELADHFGSTAYSWKGFHHDESGVDYTVFKEEHKKYLRNLGEVRNDPYMPLTEEEYKIWFEDSITPIGSPACMNVERLIDIQPSGDANFCVDFPDFSFGNAKDSSLKEIWISPRAEQFRTYRRKKPLAVCIRCGAKHIADIRD